MRYLFLSNTDVKKYKLNTSSKIISKFKTMADIAGYVHVGLIPHVHDVHPSEGYPDHGLIMEVVSTTFVAEPSITDNELPCSLV